jgi:FkbM family methyltransferase
MDAALHRLAHQHPVETIVDIGASDGRWSEMARKHYPNAAFLLVEAQGRPHEAALSRLGERHANVHYVLAAAGDHVGTIHFDASDPFGGAASEVPLERDDLVVPMTTIDAEVTRLDLAPPFLLKLDTHGFEVPVLEGAAKTLPQSDLLVVEAYNFELRPGSLRFHELCAYLDGRGFRAIDVVDVMRRPGDGVLWQFDLFFAPRDRPEFASTTYR